MWQYNYTLSSDELYHHGIMGMKWGKRNGPPYPLDSSQKSSAEKKLSRKASNSSGKSAEAKKATRKKVAKTAASVGSVAAGVAVADATVRAEYKSKPNSKYEDTLNRSSSDIKDIQNAINKTKDAKKSSKQISAKSNVDLSSMSDAELKEIVKRMNLEQQYKDLSAKQTTTGADYLDTVLDYAGSIAAIAASAVALSKVINKAR